MVASDAAYPRVEMDIAEPVTPAGSTSGAPRKAKEEYIISKLADQDFDMKKLPNPMVPRHGVDPQLFPKGVTLEMERHWMAQIEAIRARQQKQ
ncbi:hypothetical protein VFPFJ_05094 [Purpureocillium lilacinum]|nr:hypothetical protein VFPFJ_05094 [Purpureocillium lilacinum]OAQ84143.1 hypothetical protein VFPBJ_02911 [Purpureocillium lilacinum]OAQ90935.1 hypothetical protein VFPFJ_05094 [Purpureocillium lilacinum]PWI74683.1 uncharacterized protein PCL_07997 [Purpureocillium lilacinum]